MPEKTVSEGDSQGGAPRLQAELLRLESPVVQADERQIEQRFGRGRPPGAKNIASRQRAQIFEQIAGDQILAAARLLTIPLETLAKMLKCDVLDAANFQHKVRIDIAPYLYSKMPQAVAISGKVANFNIDMGSPGPGGRIVAGPAAIMALLEDMEASERAGGFDPNPGGQIERVPAPLESDDETST